MGLRDRIYTPNLRWQVARTTIIHVTRNQLHNRSSERTEAGSADTLSLITIFYRCSSQFSKRLQSACMTIPDCLDQDLTERCGHRIAFIGAMRLFARHASPYPWDRAVLCHHVLRISTTTVLTPNRRGGYGRKPARRKLDDPVPVSVIGLFLQGSKKHLAASFSANVGDLRRVVKQAVPTETTAHTYLVPMIHAHSNYDESPAKT
jgi:hypothetical protein